ncbi:MAG: alpha/beta fold hydrolase [Proteobacteria bacterium]|nr:alpha/beta fold hydrolase [Desulfobacula sp.]MBU3954628.1 alpha/beta fold hydrolase [Pseudomonadota bacterium]MBU4130999.1 alpha/beta fold hydrolase [Pseudomonadota bacterium]
MKFVDNAVKLRKFVVRFVVNEVPTHVINISYDTYSRIYKGQLNLGLPVAPELIISQEQIRNNAIGKLALTLYHIFYRITETIIPRDQIKTVLHDALELDGIRLTEKVILLTRKELAHIAVDQLNIDPEFENKIYSEAFRRNIVREALKTSFQPAYFESEVDEKENNGRGDYEIVYYRDFTEEGKEIKFRRLLSMEDVTAGDNNPSVILVPGFANNSNCFDLNNQYSIAKNLADKGKWVYLFDPRGVGVNAGRFDPNYTVDTLIDHDLPTVLNFVTQRSCGKPSILLGHSMGGLVSENMVLNWALRLDFDKIKMPDSNKAALDKILVSEENATDALKAVKGVITLGSPRCFDKKSHVFFPSALWLNHLARIFKLSHIPVQELSHLVTQMPVLKTITRSIYNKNIGGLNFLISPENHKNDKYFIERYLERAMESIPLGLGFQFLKAVYDGNGFKRMDPSALNYTHHFSFFPKEIPVFHFWGANDCLAPLENIRYSQFYPHKHKQIYRLERVEDLKKVTILPEQSQLIDFVIEGANHLDLLYGKKAKELVHPLLEQIIETVWSDWSYEDNVKINPDAAECVLNLTVD